MQASDRELMARVARRDAQAFASLYDRHAGRVLGLILEILGRREMSEDVLQETFWSAWESAGRYDPDRSSPIVWLILIARARAVDRLRRRARESRDSRQPHPGRDDVAAADGDARRERAESCADAVAALRRLPAEQREAIDLAFFRGMTHEQIARLGAVPLGTVKTRIRSGMRRLREMIEQRHEAPTP